MWPHLFIRPKFFQLQCQLLGTKRHSLGIFHHLLVDTHGFCWTMIMEFELCIISYHSSQLGPIGSRFWRPRFDSCESDWLSSVRPPPINLRFFCKYRLTFCIFNRLANISMLMHWWIRQNISKISRRALSRNSSKQCVRNRSLLNTWIIFPSDSIKLMFNTDSHSCSFVCAASKSKSM